MFSAPCRQPTAATMPVHVNLAAIYAAKRNLDLSAPVPGFERARRRQAEPHAGAAPDVPKQTPTHTPGVLAC